MKQKPRLNKRNRRKRNRKLLDRMLHTRFSRLAYRAYAKGPPYYQVIFGRPRTDIIRGQRMFSVKKQKLKVVPTVAYHKMINQLLELTKGITVRVDPAKEHSSTL